MGRPYASTDNPNNPVWQKDYAGEPVTQPQIEQEIMRLSGRLPSPEDLAVASRAAATSDASFDVRYAKEVVRLKAIADAKLTVQEVEAHAIVACEEELRAKVSAEAIWRATQEGDRNIRAQLDALRSINANVRGTIG